MKGSTVSPSMKNIFQSHISRKKPPEFNLTRGYFENLTQQEGRIIVSGWMLCLTDKLDSFELSINGKKVGSVPFEERKDVAKVFPFIPFVTNSGFRFSIPWQDKTDDHMIDIRVVGIAKGRAVAQMETWYRSDLYTCLPTPPLHLIKRVAAHDSPTLYLVTGLQTYGAYWNTICKYKNPLSIASMLDWGCGCGRVIGFFLKFSNIHHICGCDIDAEAIQWCGDYLKPAEFSTISPYPPTAYADNSFDLIISFSIFTHLSREVQFAWLQEMKRILSPGGLFLTSVHGEFATWFCFPEDAENILKNGIYELVVDNGLDGIAPEGYYRAVYQTKEYTLKEWSPYFEILEYGEGKANYYQDLVVMKKNVGT